MPDISDKKRLFLAAKVDVIYIDHVNT